jgi:hypothetical protein
VSAMLLPDATDRLGRRVLEIISLGGGLQSSGLCEMAVEGVLPRPSLVVFSDTGGEMPATYAHVEYLRGRLATIDVPLIVANNGNLEHDVLAAAAGEKSSAPSLPTRIRNERGELDRINSYHCSYDYKRRVVEREVKRACERAARDAGLSPREARGAWRDTLVRQWIGYSTDEGSRVKQPDECRCGHKRMAHHGEGKACLTRLAVQKAGGGDRSKGPEACARGCDGFEPWQVNRFPLIELGMRRGDVAVWLRDQGLPIPPRSACWFCPNRGNGHWRELRSGAPELFSRAVAIDIAIRPPSHGITGERFLHQSGVPLAEADLRTTVQKRAEDEGQDALFGDDEGASPYDCDAGVCFT